MEIKEKVDKQQKTSYTKIHFVIKLQGNLRFCLFFSGPGMKILCPVKNVCAMINQPILKSAFRYLIVICWLKSVETAQESWLTCSSKEGNIKGYSLIMAYYSVNQVGNIADIT